jgi:uncharacterized protein YjbJ (UPF0337 family)
MRFLIRLGILALAAVGAKALYDRFAPKASELKAPAGDVLGSARDAARGVTQHAKDAANEVVDDARQRASTVREQAEGVIEVAQDDEPTLAASGSATASTS